MALSAALIIPATATAQPSDDEIAANQDMQQTLPTDDGETQNNPQNDVSDDSSTSATSTNAPDYSNAVCNETINAADTDYVQALQRAITNSSNEVSRPTVICLAGTLVLDEAFHINAKHVVLRNAADNKPAIITRTAGKTGSLFWVENGGSLTVGTSKSGNDDLLRYGPASIDKNETINIGAFVHNYGTTNIVNGTFSHVSSGSHVAVYNDGIANIYGGLFSDNTSTVGVNGSVLYNNKGTLTISGGEFINNSNTAVNGGVLCNRDKLIITGGVFRDNYASVGSGGVIYSKGQASIASASISGGTFEGNQVRDEKGNFNGNNSGHNGGGAIWAQGTLSISGGTFTDNAQLRDNSRNGLYGYAIGGGAIYFDGTNGPGGVNQGDFRLTGGTFTKNYACGDGGAIFVSWGTNMVITGGMFGVSDLDNSDPSEGNIARRLGGAIYTEEDTVTYLAKAVAKENKAGRFGGGLWLCPSGSGITSKGGSMLLFNNIANDKYNYNQDGNKEDSDGAAGDDFALMSPTKNNVGQNQYELSSKGWNADVTADIVTWYTDGGIRSTTNGYGGSNRELGIDNEKSRYQDGSQNVKFSDVTNGITEDNQNGIIVRRHTGNNEGQTGVTLKSIVSSEKQTEYWGNAKVRFQNNIAYRSGGGFGTNGNIIFAEPYPANWVKADSESKQLLAGSEWKLSIHESQISSRDNGEITPWFEGDIRSQACQASGSRASTEYCWQKDTSGDNANDPLWTVTIQDNTGDANYSGGDQNPEAGEFSLVNLAAGTFTLTETKAPVGYQLSEKSYTFVTANAAESTTGQDGGMPNIKVDGVAVGLSTGVPMIGNSPSTAPISWTKVGSTDDELKPLAGSKWKLERKALPKENGESAAENTVETSYKTVYSSICDAGAENCTEAEKTADIDDAAGKFMLNLPWGYDYKLTEIQAPGGFDTPDSATTYVTFSVNLVTDPNTGESAASASAMTFHGSWPNWEDKAICPAPTSAAASRAAGDTSCLIANKPGIELPATGGAGTTAMIWAGILLVGCSLVGLSYMRRRL